MAIKNSIIIPTYNRCRSLERTLESIMKLDFPREEFEVVIVDNNSKDDTKGVAEKFRNKGIKIKYVRERRLSFTVARHAGARAARGEILLYIDDDVTVEKGWMEAVASTFSKNAEVGMIGGPIRPIFEAAAPEWISRMNGMWLSLLDRGNETKDIPGAMGPNLCIRKSVLDKVGGFPPDTIGVESGGKSGVFEKIYIGPGDWGLSRKVRKAGYRITYSPEAAVHHHIPPVRLTKRWWNSRFAGEGQYLAITSQHECPAGRIKLFLKAVRSFVRAIKTVFCLVFSFMRKKPAEIHEFQSSFYLSQMRTELTLAIEPGLAERLWKIGLTGFVSKTISKKSNVILRLNKRLRFVFRAIRSPYRFSFQKLWPYNSYIGWTSPKLKIISRDSRWLELEICGFRFFWPSEYDTSDLPWLYHEVFTPPGKNPAAYEAGTVNIKPGEWVLDGGACEGFFAAYALSKGANVLMVEPVRLLCEALGRTFKSEIQEGRARILQGCLGGKRGLTEIDIDPKSVCLTKMKNTKENSVEVYTVDGIISKGIIPNLGFVKMDIEGTEISALKGSSEVLRKSKPKLAIAVYHELYNGKFAKEIIKKARRDYKITLRGVYAWDECIPRPYMLLAT